MSRRKKSVNQPPPTKSTNSRGLKSTAREYLESLVVTVVIALFGTTFEAQAFKIPSSSMEDTLLIGDHLIVNKVPYAPSGPWSRMLPYQEIQRDQVVVFRYPLDVSTYFVKRVIGLPGDRIRLRGKRVYRNGAPIDEPYVVHKSAALDRYRDEFPAVPAPAGYALWPQSTDTDSRRFTDFFQNGEVVVPPNHYFVMGDNRDLSSDSRYWGFVPRENIVGRPLFVYWSLNASSQDYQRTGLTDYVGSFFDVLFHLPQKTRWRRMFHLM